MRFERPSNMLIQAYLNEFDKRLYKKNLMILWCQMILVYRLLKSVNLSSYHTGLVKTTI